MDVEKSIIAHCVSYLSGSINLDFMGSLMKLILYIVCLALISTPVFSGKLYKWVDKQGNVHYTQTPPPKSQVKEAAKEMNLSTNTVKPEKKRGSFYCGKDELPKLKESAAINITNLQHNIYGWEDAIERRKEERSNYMKRRSYNTKYSAETLHRYNRDDAEDRCKIDWAKAQLESLETEKEKIIERYHTVKKAIDDVEKKKLKECGKDDRTGFVVVDEKYKEYMQCNDRYNRELRKLRQEMKKAKSNYKLVNIE